MENQKTLDEKLQTREFEMFSKAGNNACRTLVRKVFRRIAGPRRLTQDDIIQMITEGCKKIHKSHPEVYDTEPGYHIQELVNEKLQEIGYCYEVSRYDF